MRTSRINESTNQPTINTVVELRQREREREASTRDHHHSSTQTEALLCNGKKNRFVKWTTALLFFFFFTFVPALCMQPVRERASYTFMKILSSIFKKERQTTHTRNKHKYITIQLLFVHHTPESKKTRGERGEPTSHIFTQKERENVIESNVIEHKHKQTSKNKEDNNTTNHLGWAGPFRKQAHRRQQHPHPP